MAMEKFHYKLTVGEDEQGDPIKQEITLPKFDNIPFGLIRKNRKLPVEEQFFSLIEALLSDDDLVALDAATQVDVSNLMAAWQKESGVSLGE